MGLHTGEAEERGGDYFGSAVNRAGRLMDLAHGGQVVASAATVEVVADTLPPEVKLVDLGEHLLRDLSRREQVFQVEAPGLGSKFPPLRSPDVLPGNLPVQPTSFVGRADEVRDLSEALGRARLVTVTGVGGVRKTRLAVQVAAELLPAFAEGAWPCELAVAGDADTLAQVVASTLGVVQRAGRSMERSVVEFLRSSRLLLVLDNCEHLLEPSGRLVAGILTECPQVRVLATSREAPAVPGEQTWPLRSLELPEPAPTAPDHAPVAGMIPGTRLAGRASSCGPRRCSAGTGASSRGDGPSHTAGRVGRRSPTSSRADRPVGHRQPDLGLSAHPRRAGEPRLIAWR
jgi:hypothetical protein